MKKLNKEQLLIGGLAGILLLVIAIPVPKEENVRENIAVETEVSRENTESLEKKLKEILQKISGVGRVEVLITYEDDGKRIVEKDESVSEELVQEADSSGGTRTTTTTRTDRETVYEGTEIPYVIRELTPAVQGILVVAEGGGSETVKMQIRETIEALFGLDSHKISIMKMEVAK